MNEKLQQESARLTRSWMRHPANWLRDYLVAGVEDPRLNLQSVLCRHFLVRALAGDGFDALMREEGRFAAAMNWLADLAARSTDAEDLAAVLYALRRSADNLEGMAIPQFVLQSFSELPMALGAAPIPNYLEQFLSETVFVDGKPRLPLPVLQTFQNLWRAELAVLPEPERRASVFEPACGSANDYRFFDAYGLARFMDYTGADLCDKNVENARELFPGVAFHAGNVFELEAPDKAFDFCVVHDLFEHLSLEGLQTSVKEVCRVTRRGLCVGFFQMDEIGEHIERPHEDYFWNLLSLDRMKALFAQCGFAAQTIHIGTFLQRQFGCDFTHNPNAYTFWLRAA